MPLVGWKVFSVYNTCAQSCQIQWPWGFVQAKSFDHADLSNEETEDNDEAYDKDKASDSEIWQYNWAKQSVCTRSLQISMK